MNVSEQRTETRTDGPHYITLQL